VGGKDEALGGLIDAFDQVISTQPIHDRLRKQHIRDWRTAQKRGLLTPSEIEALKAADRAIAEVIAVDDFAPEALTRHDELTDNRSVAAKRPTAQISEAAIADPSEPQPNIEPQPTPVLH
jgi:acyl-CoA dehydrogenase